MLLFLCLCVPVVLPLAVPGVSFAAPLIVTGGNGVDGPGGGNGADGTANTPVANAGTSFDSITVTGGNGGNGGGGFRGGAGGGAVQTLNAATVTTGSIAVTGGNGGNTGSAGGTAGDEGANASLTFSAGTTVTSTGAVVVTSGSDGAAGSFGGEAHLTVLGTLTAPSITTNSLGSSANVSIMNLNVTTIDTTLTALNPSSFAGGNLTVTTAALAGGHTLTLDNRLDDITVNNLNVSGQGRLAVLGSAPAIINLNAPGADLTFVLPANVVAGQTIVAVDTANITGTTIGVDDGNGRVTMAPGESMKLISAFTSLTGNAANLTVQTPNGDVFTLQVSGTDLLAILQQISPVNPSYERLKAFAEGRVATVAFVNQGTDLILNQGFGSALAATRGTGSQFAAFAAGSGGTSRYNTGSHVDVDGFSMLTGLAWGNDIPMGRITLGAFFEGGWGNYNSYNSFSNAASVKGDGDTSYYGGGVLGRYDLTSGLLRGMYFDASARMGRVDTDFNTNDIKYNGSKASFDTSSLYYGAHAGLGYQWNFTEKAMLDLSGKFIWTRQEGDSVNVRGDKAKFKDTDSLRTRLGGRFNYAVSEYITPYAGAYWEHEFDGKQRSSVNGVGIAAPTLKGDTGVGELGLTFRPVKDSGFSFDLGVQGYTGVREGVSGSLQLKFEF